MLTRKTPKRCHWRRSDVLIDNFELFQTLLKYFYSYSEPVNAGCTKTIHSNVTSKSYQYFQSFSY